MDTSSLLLFFPLGYFATVALEAPWLLFGLSPSTSLRQKVFASFWLTACTYPIVAITLPLLLGSESSNYYLYLLLAESFAIAAECALFTYAFHLRSTQSQIRNTGVIAMANLSSFGFGSLILQTLSR
jgi:hypothetical protein